MERRRPLNRGSQIQSQKSLPGFVPFWPRDEVPSDPSWDVVQRRAMMLSERKINNADLTPSTFAYTAPLKNGSPEFVFLKIVKDYNFDLWFINKH